MQKKTPHFWPQLPRTCTQFCLSARLPRSSGASALCHPPLPPSCLPFALLLAARFRQLLASLLFHGLHGGRGRGRDELRARPRGLLRSTAAAANDRAGPKTGRSAVVGQLASAGLPRTRPAPPMPSPLTCGASSLEDGRVLHAAPPVAAPVAERRPGVARG